MSQLSERCDGHRLGMAMIKGAINTAREVEQLSLSDSVTVLMKM